MTVIFTCGHKAKDEEEGFVISTKAYSRKNERAVEYRTVCINCYSFFEEEGRILYSESEVIEWLENP